MKYRKKPIEISAFQYVEKDCKYEPWFSSALKNNIAYYKGDELYIKTLEGDLKVNKNDFIIKGIQNEIYPCKPDIFIKTYDYVREENEITYEAIYIADFIIHYLGSKDINITYTKLEFIMYLFQLFYIKEKSRKIFKDDICCYKLHPEIKSVLRKYAVWGDGEIPNKNYIFKNINKILFEDKSLIVCFLDRLDISLINLSDKYMHSFKSEKNIIDKKVIDDELLFSMALKG